MESSIDVKTSFESLSDEVHESLLPISNYFEENYVIGQTARGSRRAVPLRYPIKSWTCYEATLQGAHRTNNMSEGWHNCFQIVNCKHDPDLYSALDGVSERAS